MDLRSSRSQLSRSNCVKRRRSGLDDDLRDAVQNLRQKTDQITSSALDLHLTQRVESLVELLEIQTIMIEALVSNKYGEISGKVPKARYSLRNDAKDALDYTRMQQTFSTWVQCLRSNQDTQPQQSSPSFNSARGRSSEVIHVDDRYKKHQIHAPEINTLTPPPTPPMKDFHFAPDSSKPRHLSINTNISNTSSIYSSVSAASCKTCDTFPWDELNQPDPRISDSACQSRIQEATSTLITAMKEKRRIPIGPLDKGTFNLHSTDYRQHYCVHDRSDRQSLVVYSQSSTWSLDFPGIPGPLKGEVAMELTVYPDCLLIVKPFKVPRHAGWKWHTLDAIGDNAKPTTIDVMFLGNGCLKLRIGLSELLGKDGMEGNEPDTLIEFVGVWSSTPAQEDLRFSVPAAAVKDVEDWLDSGVGSSVDSLYDEIERCLDSAVETSYDTPLSYSGWTR